MCGLRSFVTGGQYRRRDRLEAVRRKITGMDGTVMIRQVIYDNRNKKVIVYTGSRKRPAVYPMGKEPDSVFLFAIKAEIHYYGLTTVAARKWRGDDARFKYPGVDIEQAKHKIQRKGNK